MAKKETVFLMAPTPLLPLLLLLSGHFLTDSSSCSSHCPPSFFANETSGRCQGCAEGCVLCKDSHQCQRCRGGLYLQQGACVVECDRCLLLFFDLVGLLGTRFCVMYFLFYFLFYFPKPQTTVNSEHMQFSPWTLFTHVKILYNNYYNTYTHWFFSNSRVSE